MQLVGVGNLALGIPVFRGMRLKLQPTRDADDNLDHGCFGSNSKRMFRFARRRFLTGASVVALTTISVPLAAPANAGQPFDDGTFFTDGTGFID